MAAFTIDSEKHTTLSSLQALYEFLSDFKNFESILPADKVDDFKYSGDHASFNIRGITTMSIKIKEKDPARFISYTSEGLGKYNFTLKVLFHGDPSETGECKVELAGDLNPFILSFANQPLMQLVNSMSRRLATLELN